MLILTPDQPPRLNLPVSFESARALLWLLRHGPCYNPARIPVGVDLRLLRSEIEGALDFWLDSSVVYTLSDALALVAEDLRHQEQEVTP